MMKASSTNARQYYLQQFQDALQYTVEVSNASRGNFYSSVTINFNLLRMCQRLIHMQAEKEEGTGEDLSALSGRFAEIQAATSELKKKQAKSSPWTSKPCT